MLLLICNLNQYAIKEQINIKWHCENGLAENIPKIVDEYRIQRNLTVKI